MAVDREWWQVTRGGVTLLSDVNGEAADAFAAEAAQESDDVVCVVYNRRTEIRRYERQVTVTATEVAAVPALSAGGKA